MTAPRFDLVDLNLFVAIADANSITKGADRINLAVASASERIGKLEQALGVALLRRVRRGVELTAAGTALLDHARLVLRNVQVMQGEATNFATGVKSSVRLLANTAAYVEHLPGALASFLAADPDVAVEVEERDSADIAQARVSGAADLGIAIRDAVSNGLARYPFCDDRLVVVASSAGALATRREVAFEAIAHLPFIGLPQQSALQGHIGRQAAKLGVRLNVRARLNDVTAICRLVEAGAGIAVLPEETARRCRRTMTIKTLRLKDAWALRKLVICARDFKALPAPARRLVEHLRRHSAK
jgi:DNA-binding transcriptional LysR family regulator